ncbi:ABC transporter substrate-binding protein [Thermomonospora cellulosilytica]|uniref:ABC-type branched-subunit amino acid transport system substrate-binding protein n=1 Tax=Thermomonospora cellulosilytica TaxID=1411118 RepID=A0A7W3R631_9ACTN|nr:ABC transporter substrate-binding protein [Thermomonospora cellulosilytica]MBA9001723.1 ABC-type branched-subunit amino acid transport system substrate-binding protein [Thermomonospora cellulosilytica]
MLAPRFHPPGFHGGPVRLAALTLVVAGLAGCAGKATAQYSDSMRTGPGVAADKITVAALTDLTGPYAPLGKGVTQAQRLYFDRFNDAGGACGRKVELVVRDHGYDVRKAVTAYTEVAPHSAAIPQIIGSPITAALRARIEADRVLTVPQAWAHTLLGSKYVQIVGTTYDVDMVNGVEFLTKEHGLRAGDRIGHLYLQGDYGDSAVTGSRWAARQSRLELVEHEVAPTDNDMTAAVAAFRRAGVRAVLVSVGPLQAASLVGASAAKGLNVPFVASNSAFAEQLLDTPVGPYFEKDFYVLSAAAPPSAPIEGIRQVARDYRKTYRGQPVDLAVIAGYGAAATVGEALKKACSMRDLSREGIVAAHRSNSQFLTGLGGPAQDYSRWTVPAARSAYVLKPDRDELGGLKIHRQPVESPLAEKYTPPS